MAIGRIVSRIEYPVCGFIISHRGVAAWFAIAECDLLVFVQSGDRMNDTTQDDM